MSRDPERVTLELVTGARELGGELWLWEPKTLQCHLGIVLLPARLSALHLLHACRLSPPTTAGRSQRGRNSPDSSTRTG
jgi:hypothetical protein